ncbi:MAG: hypothetical protein R3B93_11990 [Bacteroidia bacterium]
MNIYQRENDYWVYLDPGAPPFTDVYNGGGLSDEYKWGFFSGCYVGFMDPADTTMWDISPASLGNVPVNKLQNLSRDIGIFTTVLMGEMPARPFYESTYWKAL